MDRYCLNCGERLITTRNTFCSRQCSNRYHAKQRNSSGELVNVWSCGAGVQSTGIAALIYMGKLPVPEYAIMVDTGYEKQSTWDYVYGFLMGKLREAGVDLKIIKTEDYTSNSLWQGDLLVIPAYKIYNDKKKRFNTLCNDTWKVRVVKKYLRAHGVSRCIQWIGISTDEVRRMRKPSNKWAQHYYPLIEYGISKDNCYQLIEHLGWRRPPRTSCLMCPGMSNEEWEDIRENYEEDWAKAIQVEKEIQMIDPDIYLHGSCRPLEEAIRYPGGESIENLLERINKKIKHPQGGYGNLWND